MGMCKSCDAATELNNLRDIARRAGAWQDRNGRYVYGNDTVVCDDHSVKYHAGDIEPKYRKYYYYSDE